MTADIDNAFVALTERLYDEPGDRTARLMLADLYEDEGAEQTAAVQRELADAKCYRDLTDEDRREILGALFDYMEDRLPSGACVAEEWDADLLAWTFQVRWETDSDEVYVISARDGALSANALRRKILR